VKLTFVTSKASAKCGLCFVETDLIRGNVHADARVGQGVAVVATVAAGVAAIDVVAAVAAQQHLTRREVVLPVAAEPEEVAREV